MTGLRLETRVVRTGLYHRVEVFDTSTETWRRSDTCYLRAPTPAQIDACRDVLVAAIRRELLVHAHDLEELAGVIE